MIPPLRYFLSLLTVKLFDKERKSPICDWTFDEALGLFSALVVPKLKDPRVNPTKAIRQLGIGPFKPQ